MNPQPTLIRSTTSHSSHEASCWNTKGDSNLHRCGTAVHLRIGFCHRLRVGLDTDPQTDPLHRPTAQVKRHNSGSPSPPTDPSRGLSRGGI